MKKIKFKSRKKAFEYIYNERYWGEDNLSGGGSRIDTTETTRKIILKIVKDYNIKSIVDVACGDFVWMPLVLKKLSNLEYTGCDIVDDLVVQHNKKFPQFNFKTLDFVEEAIPKGELIICREALQHLPVKDINMALNNFSRNGANYLLATIHLRRFGFRNGRNIRPGRCRDRNLMLSPFNLPDPLIIYSEQIEGKDKFLGLWKLPFYK